MFLSRGGGRKRAAGDNVGASGSGTPFVSPRQTIEALSPPSDTEENRPAPTRQTLPNDEESRPAAAKEQADKVATWIGKFNDNRRTYSNIGCVGRVDKKIELDLGILKIKRWETNRLVLEFLTEDNIRYICWASKYKNGNKYFQLFKENYSYIVKGVIWVNEKSRIFDRLVRMSASANYSLNLYQIEIVKEEVKPDSDDRTTLRPYIELVQDQESFIEKIEGLKIVQGEIYRYKGCVTCTKSLNSDGSFKCNRCPEPKHRRGYIVIRDLTVSDVYGNELSDAVIHHKDCVTLIGESQVEKLCNTVTDNDAKDEFPKLIGTTFNGTIAYAKPRTRTGFKPSVVFKEITNVSPPDSDSENSQPSNTSNSNQDSQNSQNSNPTKRPRILSQNNSQNADGSESQPRVTGIDARPIDNEDECSPRLSQTQELRDALNSVPVLSPLQLQAREESGIYPLKKSTTGYYGLVLIVNINTTSDHNNARQGSDVDVQSLEELFPRLGIEIFKECAFWDLTVEEFKKRLVDFQEELIEHKHSSSFVIVMSHGRQNYVTMTDGKEINVYNDIIFKFSDDEFVKFRGKPKIFLFQACQGVNTGYDVGFYSSADLKLSDTLWCFPCLPGQSATRDIYDGAYFIRAVTKCLERHYQDTNLHKILRDKVQWEMRNLQEEFYRYRLERFYGNLTQDKEMPVKHNLVSVATSIYFRKFIFPVPSDESQP